MWQARPNICSKMLLLRTLIELAKSESVKRSKREKKRVSARKIDVERRDGTDKVAVVLIRTLSSLREVLVIETSVRFDTNEHESDGDSYTERNDHCSQHPSVV